MLSAYDAIIVHHTSISGEQFGIETALTAFILLTAAGLIISLLILCSPGATVTLALLHLLVHLVLIKNFDADFDLATIRELNTV